MTQGVNASSGGNVSLQPQEVNSTTVNRRLVVASPGYSKETRNLFIRIVLAFMDAIQNEWLRFRAGLFFNPGKVDQVLGQLNIVAHAKNESEMLAGERKLEELLQDLSKKGVYYILGEFAKQISDSAEGTDLERIRVKVNLFDVLCEECYLKSSLKRAPYTYFIDKYILNRLDRRERLEIYTVLGWCNSTSMDELAGGFKWSFKICTYLADSKNSQALRLYSDDFLKFLKEQLYNVERVFFLLGHTAKHVLVDDHGSEDVAMGINVYVFDELFKIFYKKGHFKGSYSLQNCALWVLNQLEEKDREKAIGVLREHGSVLVKGLG